MAGGYPINPAPTQATTGTSGRPCFDVHASTPDANVGRRGMRGTEGRHQLCALHMYARPGLHRDPLVLSREGSDQSPRRLHALPAANGSGGRSHSCARRAAGGRLLCDEPARPRASEQRVVGHDCGPRTADVLARSPIRGDQQADLAVACLAARAPPLTCSSLMLGTRCGSVGPLAATQRLPTHLCLRRRARDGERKAQPPVCIASDERFAHVDAVKLTIALANRDRPPVSAPAIALPREGSSTAQQSPGRSACVTALLRFRFWDDRWSCGSAATATRQITATVRLAHAGGAPRPAGPRS
jgi:hypothetical protein